MTTIQISPKAIEAIKSFQLPEEIGFGKVMSPVMAVADFKNGEWGPLELLPYGPISMMPVSKVLHYGQEIFEGLKAYKVDAKGPFLFRPDQNARRFNLSATRMAMPTFPEEQFIEAVRAVTAYSADFIPQKSGESLYIRPFMFATEESLGIRPSESFKFMVVASPSGSYFTNAQLKVLIERQSARACPGGTGAAKTGGNYAASLISAKKVAQKGFMQTLWLDSKEKKYVEEMSGMNIFFVIDNKLVTPKLTDTILDGITRKSLIQIAQELKIDVCEDVLEINQVIQSIKDGRCTEAFACGTAAIITPIVSFHEDSGEAYEIKTKNFEIAQKLRSKMLDIQEGRAVGPDGWVQEVHTQAAL